MFRKVFSVFLVSILISFNVFAADVQHSDLTGAELHIPFNTGLDANKSATPAIGDVYFATDTGITYKCYITNTWVGIADGNGHYIGVEGLVVAIATVATVDIDATGLNVGGYYLSSINLTATISASGANGLDTGSEASSTWYSVWVIFNPTTRTQASLLSVSATSPTMPSGYTVKRRVGWVYNSSSSNFTIIDNIANTYTDRGDPAAADLTESGMTLDNSYYDWDMSAIIPPSAVSVVLRVQIASAGVGNSLRIRKNGNSNALNIAALFIQVSGVATESKCIIPCDSSQIIEYAGQSGSTATLVVVGWFK